MKNPFYSNYLSLLSHSSVFFIISLSKAVYFPSFGAMCECNIFGFVFNIVGAIVVFLDLYLHLWKQLKSVKVHDIYWNGPGSPSKGITLGLVINV